MFTLFSPLIPFHRNVRAVSVGLLLCASAAAATDPVAETLQISADDFRGSLGGEAVVSGNVSLEYGSVVLKADTITLVVSEGTFSRAEAKGTPVKLQYETDEGEDERIVSGHASTVSFLVDANLIELSGDAKLESDEVSITGQKITIDVEENQIRAKSKPSGEQVEIKVRNLDSSASDSDS